MSQYIVARLRVEHRPDALGIQNASPRLSWCIEGDGAASQRAYEVRMTRADSSIEVARIERPEQILVRWPFAALNSREAVTVDVRVELTDGTVTSWSPSLTIEAGLLDASDWKAQFISPSLTAGHDAPRPAALMRTEFRSDDHVIKARLYATAHGIYSMTLNGVPVGDQELTPGWTSYGHRLRYQVYDVTQLIAVGDNAIGAQLADGWYRGRLGFHGGVWDNYGTHVALLAQLEFETADGTRSVVPITERWRFAPGPVLAAGLYDGETFDARLEPSGWDRAGFDDSGWQVPHLVEAPSQTARLEASVSPPVRVVEVLAPVTIQPASPGRVRVDFGQNIAGRLAIRVRGEAGHTVRLHHAEVLEHGELAVRPLRTAPSVDSYTLRGDPQGESWTPTFSIHGFRYAELENWPGTIGRDDVQALVMHTDMERTGWFDSSSPLLDRLHENVVWSMRGNFVDLPTDCPQRDERLGWTGDIQVFAPAATFLYDCAGLLDNWLQDLAAEQSADGHVPNFVPWIACGFPVESSAAWGDAATIVPWVLYERTGDAEVLQRQYISMARWVDHLAAMADGGLIRSGFQLGDWLDPAAPSDSPADGVTDKYLVANAYLVRSARIVAETARILGNLNDEARYRELATQTENAFRSEYVTSEGRLSNETVTSISLALTFDLLQVPADRAHAGERLAGLVAEGGYRVQTGFVGTPIVCDALVAAGAVDTAYRLLLEEACPSWLYPVTMGATTIWERWDSMLPDGSINPGEMTSFNHYAFGAVADFMHRVVAGLAPASLGYRTIRIAPKPGKVLRHASARLRTPYGVAESRWKRRDNDFTLDILIPIGTSAEIVLPDAGATVHHLEAGSHRLTCSLQDSASANRPTCSTELTAPNSP